MMERLKLHSKVRSMDSFNIINKNRKGHKKTKIGWIPKEWEIFELRDLFKLSSGKKRPTVIKEYKNEQYNIPVMGGNGIVGYSNINIIDGENIIIGRVGEYCGNVFYSNSKAYVTDNALVVMEWRKQTIIKFLSYLLTSIKLGRFRNKGGQPLISQNLIYPIKVALPTLSEQKKIAKILSTWDKAIEQTQKLIDAKKRLKKGLMQQLLTGKKRFPEFENDQWKNINLGEVLYPYSRINIYNEDLPIMSCSKVHGITFQNKIFNKRIASKETSRYKIIEKNDLVYDPMLLWDTSIGFVKLVEKGIISPAYYTFKFKDDIAYRPYFEFLIYTHYLRYNYKSISVGTNRRRRKASKESFLKITVQIPKNIDEQKKIANSLLKIKLEILLLQKRLDLVTKQKKGLMQQLLTGRRRVG